MPVTAQQHGRLPALWPIPSSLHANPAPHFDPPMSLCAPRLKPPRFCTAASSTRTDSATCWRRWRRRRTATTCGTESRRRRRGRMYGHSAELICSPQDTSGDQPPFRRWFGDPLRSGRWAGERTFGALPRPSFFLPCFSGLMRCPVDSVRPCRMVLPPR